MLLEDAELHFLELSDLWQSCGGQRAEEEEEVKEEDGAKEVTLSSSGSPLSTIISSPPLPASFFLLFQSFVIRGADALTHIPPGGFPGSLTIFL